MKKTIIILCTWSKDIGIGHVKRSESLSRSILELEKEINLFIFLNNIKELPDFIKFPDQIKLIEIRNLSETFLKKHHCKLIVFDIIEDFRLHFLNQLKNVSIPKALISDSDVSDFGSKNKDFRIIINGNPELKSFVNFNKSKVIMEGIKYFIVDPNYQNIYQERKRSINNLIESKKRLLVTVGGTDHNNILRDLLINLAHVFKDYFLDVYTNKKIESKLIDDLEILNIRNLVFFTNTSELYSKWNKYHFAITSGGNTLFERITSGTPGATICQLPRQDQIASKFEKLGCNINLGMWNKIDENLLKSKLINLFPLPLLIPEEKIKLDGKGGIRVAEALLEYISLDKL